jgi:hypothetical protein
MFQLLLFSLNSVHLEECLHLGYKTPVRTSQETGFHGSDYDECRLVGFYVVWLL